MSLPSAPRELASDAFDHEPVEAIDRELDLAAERPHVEVAPRPQRGAVLLAASIVAGSLALAGIISLVRGEPEHDPDAAEATIAVPLASSFAPPEPIAPVEPVAPPKVAKASSKGGKHKATASATGSAVGSSSPKPAVAAGDTIPAAVAPITPHDDDAAPTSAPWSALPTTAEPSSGAPEPEPPPAASAADRGASLPGVDDPDDDGHGHADDDASSPIADEPGSRAPMTDRPADEADRAPARASDHDLPDPTVST